MHNKLIKFLNNVHSEYHCVEEVSKILANNHFKEVSLDNDLTLEAGENYYFKTSASLIAFKIPKNIKTNYYYKIVASHLDSPTLKVRRLKETKTNLYNSLEVEIYGGPILSTFFDKPLGLAGKVVINDNNTLKTHLVDLKKSFIIPNVPIHLNRELNNGYIYNKDNELKPLISLGDESSLIELLAKELKINKEAIAAYDLETYNQTPAQVGGLNDEFIYGSRLDNLASIYLSVEGLLSSKEEGINLIALFNNEEIGSKTIEGADSTLLELILKRINHSLNKNDEELSSSLKRSFLISLDNAHALNPNRSDLYDTQPVIINSGIVIKHNSNMLYISSPLSVALVKLIASNNNIPYQEYYNKTSQRGGSTLGALLNSHLNILGVDLGLGQLAMHSSYEVGGIKDLDYMYLFLNKFFNTPLEINGQEIKIK